MNATMMSEFPETLVKTHRIIVVYYESMKRKLKIKTCAASLSQTHVNPCISDVVIPTYFSGHTTPPLCHDHRVFF